MSAATDAVVTYVRFPRLDFALLKATVGRRTAGEGGIAATGIICFI